MPNRLQDRVAVVTGASSGNGRAIALALAAEGASVVCGDLRKSARSEGYEANIDVDTDDLIRVEGGKAEFRETDVTKADDVKALVDLAVSAFGRLDIMVNNAGTFTELHTILDETEEQFDLTMAVNTKGVWLGCKYALTQMVKQEPGSNGVRGKVVNIASIGGTQGLPFEPAYCTSKGAVVNLTRQLALDFGRERIAVNAICPGLIETGMVRAWLDSPDLQKAYDGSYPWADRGKPRDVANAVVYLASDDSSYVHGSIFAVDGGMAAGGYSE
jgi:NAD(P)-dependent dehydrogenase (short-subunit alcohol dehydrogenase family)